MHHHATFHLGFYKFYIFNNRNGQECRTTSLRQIFVKIARTAVEILPIFGFFKMAVAVILDLKNFKF